MIACHVLITRGNLKGQLATGYEHGYRRHRAINQAPCAECLEAHAAYEAARPGRRTPESAQKRRDYAVGRKVNESLEARQDRLDYHRSYKRQHRSELAEGARQRMAKNLAVINDLKLTGCVDCDLTPVSLSETRNVSLVLAFTAFDFDHLPGTEKLRAIGNLIGGTAERLLNEVKKCEVVCSNCHRLRTFSRPSQSGRPPLP